jgi:hypothetical protein
MGPPTHIPPSKQLPQLERLIIKFPSSVSNRDIERQLLHTPVTVHVTQPNLRLFCFVGVSGFMDAVLPHMVTPVLQTFRLLFFKQHQFSVGHLPHFIIATEKLRSNSAKLVFDYNTVILLTYVGIGGLNNFSITVPCGHLDGQVSSVTQICNFLRPLFSNVVDLSLDYRKHSRSSERNDQVDRMQWRKLLGSFRNVKTLRVDKGRLVGEISRSLILNGEPPLELLPELIKLVCPRKSVDDRTFAPFIREREVAGQPVNLIGPGGRSVAVTMCSVIQPPTPISHQRKTPNRRPNLPGSYLPQNREHCPEVSLTILFILAISHPVSTCNFNRIYWRESKRAEVRE